MKLVFGLFLTTIFFCSSLLAANKDRIYIWKCSFCGSSYKGEQPPVFSFCLHDTSIYCAWTLIFFKQGSSEES